MRNGQNGRRRRGGGLPRAPGQTPRTDMGNRSLERVRGNAHQLLEKYKQLARDASQAGDRVTAEYYLQHADHYFRTLSEFRARQEEQRPRQNGQSRDDDYDDEGFDAPEPLRVAEMTPVGNAPRPQVDNDSDMDDDDEDEQDSRDNDRASDRGNSRNARGNGDARGNRDDRGNREDRGNRAEPRREEPRREEARREDPRRPEPAQAEALAEPAPEPVEAEAPADGDAPPRRRRRGRPRREDGEAPPEMATVDA